MLDKVRDWHHIQGTYRINTLCRRLFDSIEARIVDEPALQELQESLGVRFFTAISETPQLYAVIEADDLDEDAARMLIEGFSSAMSTLLPKESLKATVLIFVFEKSPSQTMSNYIGEKARAESFLDPRSVAGGVGGFLGFKHELLLYRLARGKPLNMAGLSVCAFVVNLSEGRVHPATGHIAFRDLRNHHEECRRTRDYLTTITKDLSS
jgi:hypothetical protein